MQTTTQPSLPSFDHPQSPRLGDEIVLERDALLEIQVASRRAPRTWRFVERGTRGRLIARHDGVARVVLHGGPNAREVAFVVAAALAPVRPGTRPI